MTCPRCQHENPLDAAFCEECGARLEAVCPRCQAANRLEAKFCKQCGTTLAPGASPTASRFASPQTYTPRYLAEKILTSRSALEGERKQVTVLFADLKGSMELLADRDPEEARKILDPVLELMMEAVHRYEGTVNQVMGDGIMALFGAPLAHEDHAVRACYAALRMQESVKRHAEEVERTLGLEIAVRVGVNSGDVVVRSIGSDLHMDYTAVGQTTHLAARMEQIAPPGRIRVTADTLRLAEGFVRADPLGLTVVRGLPEPLEIFDLVGPTPSRSRLQARAARGLTPFVGRQMELAALLQALERATTGHGQVVAVIGEPGVGKSRLVWEFAHSQARGCLVLEGNSAPFGQATPYLPAVELLKAYLQIQDLDDAHKIQEKVSGKLSALDESLLPLLPALLSLLDVPVDDAEWQALDPLQRRQRTLEACKGLLLRETRVQPLILLFEDLHWIDPESQAFLDTLVDGLPTARALLIISYRPEYRHGWANNAYYTQVRVDPLSSASATELLDSILGDDATLRPVKRLLIDRTEGNPLFLEENVRTLAESKVLLGERGAYRAGEVLDTLPAPATVHAVLAARIDRLPPDEKGILQTAAVIGKDVPFHLLTAVAELPEPQLRRALAHLRAAEVIYETTAYPELEYTFRHALTHEVAYGSLLQDHRRSLHARILVAIEQRSLDRLTGQFERLAYHASHAGLWGKAVAYLREAARKSMRRGAYRGAVANLEQALAAVDHLPRTRDTMAEAIDLRFLIRHSLVALGDVAQMRDHLRAATILARTLGDQRRLAALSAYMTHYFWYVSEHDQAIEAGRQALALASDLGDLPVRLETNLYLGHAHHWRGDYVRAIELLTENADVLAATPMDSPKARLFATFVNSVLAFSLATVGRFGEAGARAEEALRIAEQTGHPYQLTWACFGISYIAYLKEEISGRAIAALERGLRLCEAADIPDLTPFVVAFLGHAHARARRAADAVPLLDRFVAGARAQGRVMFYTHGGFIAAEGYLMAGRLEEAVEVAQRSLALAREHNERGCEALARRALAEIASHREPLDVETTINHYQEAMHRATALGMRPLLAHCHLGLGKLYRRTRQSEQAQEHLTTAATMYREMDMRFGLEHAETELKTLS